MENSGGGVTFTEKDLVLAKRIAAMIDAADFKVGGVELIKSAEAVVWYVRDLMKHIEANILEVRKLTKAKEEAKDVEAPAPSEAS